MQIDSILTEMMEWSYEQSGSLSALGLTYSIELIRASLSFGLTFNIWDDSISPNQWTQYYHMSGDGQYGSNFYTVTENKSEEYTFDGYNFNLGLLWIIILVWELVISKITLLLWRWLMSIVLETMQHQPH